MFDSVRVRLTAWYSAILTVALVVVCLATYFIVRQTSFQRTDSELVALSDSFVVTFQAEFSEEGHGQDSAIARAARQATIEHRSKDDSFILFDQTGQPIGLAGDLAPSLGGAVRSPARILNADQFQRFAESARSKPSDFETIRAVHSHVRAYSHQITAKDQTLQLITIHSLHQQDEVLKTIRFTLAAVIGLGLFLAATSGYFLARKALAPVSAMGAHARRIGATNLHERLPIQNPNDELGQLATIFNDLLNRLDQSFERQRRFIADASHELRTPLAILRGEAEVALSQKHRSAEEYQESLRILNEETSRLIKIVEDLFTLTRADSGQYRLSTQDVYLEEVVADCAHSLRTLASEKNIDLKADASAECLVQGDQALLRRMLLNLLDNAIKYTPPGGRVEIASSTSESGSEVHVTDTGEGIPAELHSRVFERFFRADQARSRPANENPNESGAGLGLSIAQWIAQAHNGRLELVRSDAAGSHFAVFLPLHPSRTSVPIPSV